jgi:tetratricopeptide (TPR) repeat protein
MVYAYLQSGRDDDAKRVMDSIAAISSRLRPDSAPAGAAPPLAGYYATAAIPARYALERGDWASAARIEPQTTAIPYADAMSWFARGLGAARMGDVAKARESAKALDAIRLKLAQANETYWTRQVEIQEINVLAWTSLAEKDTDYALTRMHAAVEKEDATEKSAVTPGPLAPARELLGDMLLQLNRPAEALKEYEKTMAKEPNRFRAVYGAAHSAKLAGDEQAARRYSAELLKICSNADRPGRQELADARAMAGAGGTGK